MQTILVQGTPGQPIPSRSSSLVVYPVDHDNFDELWQDYERRPSAEQQRVVWVMARNTPLNAQRVLRHMLPVMQKKGHIQLWVLSNPMPTFVYEHKLLNFTPKKLWHLPQNNQLVCRKNSDEYLYSLITFLLYRVNTRCVYLQGCPPSNNCTGWECAKQNAHLLWLSHNLNKPVYNTKQDLQRGIAVHVRQGRC